MTTALLLVDIQRDYFPRGAMELEGSAEAGERAHALLARFRREGLPTVHIQHIAPSPSATFFLPGTPGAEIHPCVAPKAGETVVQKHFPNAFRETPLLEHLRRLGADRLVLCGMMTHMCVDATVRAASDLGYGCILAGDACASKALASGGIVIPAEHVHLAFLSALASAYAEVRDTKQILASPL